MKSNSKFLLILLDTWSVGNNVKSSGGFVMTYRLEEASHDELVSRNLEDSNTQSENVGYRFNYIDKNKS